MWKKLKSESGASDLLSLILMLSIVVLFALLFRENIIQFVKKILSLMF